MFGKVVGLIVVLSICNNVYGQTCVNCNNAFNTGQGSTAIGYNAQSPGSYSLALGFNSYAGALRSVALGNQASVSGSSGIAIGNLVTSSAMNSITLGTGCSGSVPLVNNVLNSLMIGFNSNLPTLYIGPASGPETMGNVGIGTIFPSERLSVNGCIESKTGGIKFPDGTIQLTKAFTPWQQGSSDRIFYMNGNIGIGTPNPVSSLDVYGDIVLGKPGDNFIIHSRAWVGDALVIAPQNNNGGWDWGKSFSLKDNGQVFIGGELAFTSPHTGYKLAVNGKTVCREVIVTMQNWADDVFESHYNLLPLSDIQQHIKLYQRLPGVPSEKEIIENGLLLGEMNKILMTKVEELTLHCINLQHQIDDLTLLLNQEVK
ncbi:MAG: hypothetical protein AB9842_06365 [Bacteroidales bacterium]